MMFLLHPVSCMQYVARINSFKSIARCHHQNTGCYEPKYNDIFRAIKSHGNKGAQELAAVAAAKAEASHSNDEHNDKDWDQSPNNLGFRS